MARKIQYNGNSKVIQRICEAINDLIDGGGSSGLTILSYGNSTWNDFITAYQSNSVVYCRASSNANPASGSQNRLAFMAYVNNASSPTSVEFQYYRSIATHTDAQQGDQVFVYTLTSSGTWTVTTRSAFTKISAGNGLKSSYSNGTLTVSQETLTATQYSQLTQSQKTDGTMRSITLN